MQKQFDTNVLGSMKVTKAVLPVLRSQKSGTIVNISSASGLRAIPTTNLYSASKYAVKAISEALY